MNVSNPEKIFYPGGVTKADVVEYYQGVADVMLPHLRGRPLTLRRFPDGIEGEGWFQKHPGEHFPEWLRTGEVPVRAGGTALYVVCEDVKTLVYLVDQATLEFHVWLSTVDEPERPHRLVLDIDPPDGVAVAE
ncbi:MAG TPA: ATP-dependent DNA ligase, partial [Amycolatopsis sp.]|nr:ATP-dependent DNA ligase [Amycolatopsis sp.]